MLWYMGCYYVLMVFIVFSFCQKCKAEVSALTPRVAFLDRQRVYLSVNNGDLKQRIAALNQDKLFKDGISFHSLIFLYAYLIV